jgi:hypothetical protein
MSLTMDAPAFSGRGLSAATPREWRRVDWSRSDHYIAVELGINKARVNAVRTQSNIPCATHEKIHARAQFAKFLKNNRKKARELAIPELVAEFCEQESLSINRSAAYRVAMSLKYRGHRRNKSRYDPFWETINWMLPDSDLSEIWGVERGNIQSRRKTLSMFAVENVLDKPLWHRSEFEKSVQYQEAFVREKMKARNFKHPRPS